MNGCYDLYWMRPYAKRLVERMEAHGYYYDDLASYKGSLRFTFITMCGIPCTYFKSWREVAQFLHACVFE